MIEGSEKALTKDKKNCHIHLRIHYGVITILYAIAFFVSSFILSLPETHASLVTLLSSGAILATFGSAIGTVGLIWQNDLLERVRLNVDILNKDIIKQDIPWRRWPFLPRSSKRKLLSRDFLELTLSNPEVPLDVGTHVIKIHLPTTMEDFFDLPLLKNFWPLLRFRNSAHTVYGRKPNDEKNPVTGLTPLDEYMSYECMFDIWKAIVKFRVSRYIVHFGSGVTISGASIVALYVLL